MEMEIEEPKASLGSGRIDASRLDAEEYILDKPDIFNVCQIDFNGRCFEDTECTILMQFSNIDDAVVYLNGMIDDLYLSDEEIGSHYKIYKLRNGTVDLYRQYFTCKVLETRFLIRKVEFRNIS